MGLISDGTTIFDAGAMSAGLGGSMTLIKSITASGASSVSFMNGGSGVVFDGTYKEYLFIIKIGIHHRIIKTENFLLV